MGMKENNPMPVDASAMIDQARGRTRRLQPYDPSGPETVESDELPLTDAETRSQESERSPEIPEDSPRPAVSKEDSRRRKNKGVDYGDFFFQEAQVKTRSGKVVYIRKEYHDRMLKILRIIGQNEISLFSYLDNVLKHHFDTFQDDITRLYKEKNTDEYLDQ